MTTSIMSSAKKWASSTIFDDYVVPLLQKEIDVDRFGVCGELIPVPKNEAGSRFTHHFVDHEEGQAAI